MRLRCIIIFTFNFYIVCGGVYSNSDGILRSPYYPNAYPKNRECIFLISAQPGQGILLDFMDFEVESGYDSKCQFDYLEVINRVVTEYV